MKHIKLTDTRRMRQRKAVDTSDYAGRFAVRLRALRDKTGMSADEFAATHGFARTTFYNWESGIKSPPLNKLPEIAKAFGISIAKLLPNPPVFVVTAHRRDGFADEIVKTVDLCGGLCGTVILRIVNQGK